MPPNDLEQSLQTQVPPGYTAPSRSDSGGENDSQPGDGRDSEETSTFYGPDRGPLTIESEAEIPVDETSGLHYAASDYGGDQAGPVPAAYPKGVAGFYVMRRELTEGQYAAFLSTLSGRALAARDITMNPAYGESGGTLRVYDTVMVDDPERPASFITWADAIGWAAWAGLRPIPCCLRSNIFGMNTRPTSRGPVRPKNARP